MPWLSCITSNVVLASLLALTAWFVQRWLRQQAVARVLWVLVLIKLVTPPLVSLPLSQAPGAIICAIGACGCGQHAFRQTIFYGTLPWVLLAVWSTGAGVTAWNAWRRWNRFQRLVALAALAPAQWQSLAARLSAELGIRRPPQILAVPGRLPPLVVAGWRRSRMLLPISLMGRLNASQRDALVLHELIHIKRRDHLVRIVELAVSVVYWWLPLIGSIGRQLRACEETCCDAAVVAHLPHVRRSYARLLLDVVDFADPLPAQVVPQATAMSAASDLEQRLRAILDAGRPTRHTWPAAALAVGLACAALPCELHFDLVARTTPATSPDECAPDSETMLRCGPALEAKVDTVFYCPS